MSWAFHWYSGVVPTVMLVEVPATTCVTVHAPDASTAPHEALPAVLLVLVAQFTSTDRPTRSVRYGLRVNSGAGGLVHELSTPTHVSNARTPPHLTLKDENTTTHHLISAVQRPRRRPRSPAAGCSGPAEGSVTRQRPGVHLAHP